MRLLLDTHIFIWACTEPERLAVETAAALATPVNEVVVSAASAWEIAIKHASGRLDFPPHRTLEWLAKSGFEPLAMSFEHAIAAGALPRHHNDPFDRMLVAQARLEGLVLVSDDPLIRRYDVPIFAADSS